MHMQDDVYPHILCMFEDTFLLDTAHIKLPGMVFFSVHICFWLVISEEEGG